MPVFVERFLLPLLAASLLGGILLNPLKLDRYQQVSLGIAVVFFAYFLAHTIHKVNEGRNSSMPPGGNLLQPVALPPQDTERKDGSAKRPRATETAPSRGRSETKKPGPQTRDRSVTIGNQNTLTNSPIITGDIIVTKPPPRGLTQEQIFSMNEVLKGSQGALRLIYPPDGDGARLAEQIASAFGKWRVTRLAVGNQGPGLFVIGSPTVPDVALVVKAFEAAGLKYELNPKGQMGYPGPNSLGPYAVIISVGTNE